MIARKAFGGSLETQAGIGTLVILTTISVVMAYVNIKRLQIDQHRAVSLFSPKLSFPQLNLIVDASSYVLPWNHYHSPPHNDYLCAHNIHN